MANFKRKKAKNAKCGRYYLTIDERAHRHAANASLRVLRQSRGDDVILDAASVGGYYD